LRVVIAVFEKVVSSPWHTGALLASLERCRPWKAGRSEDRNWIVGV